jgi:hypothetical protein
VYCRSASSAAAEGGLGLTRMNAGARKVRPS